MKTYSLTVASGRTNTPGEWRSSHATTTIARSAPVHLSIPSLGISVPVTQLGLNSNGSVVVPTSFHIPGWYKDGYAPGQKGSAAILGHVDSTSGPGVFYRIVNMKVGQIVQVTLADHVRLKFKVIGLRQYTKANFPERLVYGPSTFSALDLVTCGGVFDATTHHYLSNIVVFTALAAS
jgi:sortase (surface protein transpeptidase)